MDFSGLAKTSACQDAARRLRELIRQSGLPPGARLPSERQLVARLGISRAPIREALRMLEIMGFVAVRPGSGTFVSHPDGGVVLPVTAGHVDRMELLRDHYETRLFLEPGAAALASRRATAEMLAHLREALEQFDGKLKRGDILAAIMADTEFHRLIAAAARNHALMFALDALGRYLHQQLQHAHATPAAGKAAGFSSQVPSHLGGMPAEGLALFLFVGLKASLYLPDRMTRTSREHRAVLRGIAGRSPDTAARAMRRHLENALRDLPAREAKVPQPRTGGGRRVCARRDR